MRPLALRSLMLTLVLCLGLSTESAHAADDPVVLGAIYNQDGFQAELDLPSMQGAQLAVSQINAAGGILKRTVELMVKDGRSNPELVNAAADQLIDDYPTLSAMFGLSDTDMVMAAAPAAAAAELVFLTSGATSPKLPDQVPDYLFLACFGDNVQAAAGAEWAYDALGSRTAAVLYDSTKTYPTLLQQYFRSRFNELGGEVVAVRAYDPADLPDSLADFEAVDLIFLGTGPASEAVPVIQRLRKAGHYAPILGGDGYDAEEVWAAHPDIRDVFFTTHVYLGEDNPDPQVAAFREAYMAAFGSTPTAFSALGYDAARLLLVAMEERGSSKPADVLQGLASIKAYHGVSGTVGYAHGSRIPRKSVTVISVKDGRQALVTTRKPKSVPAP